MGTLSVETRKEIIELYEKHKPTTLGEVFELTETMPTICTVYLTSLMYRTHRCSVIDDIEEQLAVARKKRRSELSADVVERMNYAIAQDQIYSTEVVSAIMPEQYSPLIYLLASKQLFNSVEVTANSDILALLEEVDYEVAYKHYLYTEGESYFKTIILRKVTDEVSLCDAVINFVVRPVPKDIESVSRTLIKLLSDALIVNYGTYRKLYGRITIRTLLD